MARRGIPKAGVGWFIKEWMDTLHINQAEMMKRTGWAKASMSQIYNGKQDYNPNLIKAAAVALHLEPFELLMPPERAMALRQQREVAAQIVKNDPVPIMEQHPEVESIEDHQRKRKAS